MSKFLSVAIRALTIGLAIGGCVVVPLLVYKVSTMRGERDVALGREIELKKDLHGERSRARKSEQATAYELRQARKERDEFKQDLMDARDELDRQNLALAASSTRILALQRSLEKTQQTAQSLARQPVAAKPAVAVPAAGKNSATPKATNKQVVRDAKPKPDKGKTVAAAKLTEGNDDRVRFDDDSLYDDKGWKSSRPTNR